MRIVFSVESDTATPWLREITARIQPRHVAALLGPCWEDMTRMHIAHLGTNKKGWPSTHFWEDASDSTRFEPKDYGFDGVIDKQGFRQRVNGGPIDPVDAGALTIPISPRSYGKRASEFTGMWKMTTQNGAYLVMYADAQTQKFPGEHKRVKGSHAPKAQLFFLYKLAGHVDQAPNPGALPTDEQYFAAFDAVMPQVFGN